MNARPITDPWEVTQDTATAPKAVAVKSPKPKKDLRVDDLDLDPRFKETVYMVEATHFEKFALWERNERYKTEGLSHIKKWEQGSGVLTEIGQISKRPIVVSFFFDKLDGKTVCFFEATSQVVDHELIDNWLDANFPKIKRTNADNFHHVVHHLHP